VLFRSPFGKETEAVPDAIPGDIVVIAKLEGVALYDTLSANADCAVVSRPVLPVPMVSLAVSPKSRGDEQRLSVSLEKLVQEDPTFRVSRDVQTHEMVVSGMSTLHLDVMLGRLKKRFNVEVTTKEPKIPYRETISVKGEGQHRHKKQTGGHGQFGEVWLKLEPLPRGAGFEFVDDVVGGTIPTQYIPSVEKGIRKTLVKGVLAGYPVDDVRAIVYFGKYHDVDSSDAAFQTAASQAFKKGFMACKPVLLEPIVNLEITVPSQYMGDISGNIVSRRGRIVGMESLAEMQVIKATAPLSEVTRYATELRSLTGGQGYFTMEFSHYDIVPAHVAEPIIAALKRTEEEEE
jgi:elongation factor G